MVVLAAYQALHQLIRHACSPAAYVCVLLWNSVRAGEVLASVAAFPFLLGQLIFGALQWMEDMTLPSPLCDIPYKVPGLVVPRVHDQWNTLMTKVCSIAFPSRSHGWRDVGTIDLTIRLVVSGERGGASAG